MRPVTRPSPPRALLPFLLALLLLAPGVAAQQEDPVQEARESLLDFQVDLDSGFITTPMGGTKVFLFVVRDTSRDSPGAFLPGSSTPGVIAHSFSFEVTTERPLQGWFAAPPAGASLYSGQERTFELYVSVTPQASEPLFPFNLTVTMRSGGGEVSRTYPLVATTPGLQAFSAQVPRGLQLSPMEIGSLEVRIMNQGVFPRTYSVVASSECPLRFGQPADFTVPAKEMRPVQVDVLAPAEKLRYVTESCSVGITVRPLDNPSQAFTTSASVQLHGTYIDPQWVINTLVVLALLLLILLFIRTRKARIEEEILGKPQRPWTIPAEVVYLDALKERDPRAWYVVRHYLMEDEYRSALLWYKHEKRATRGTRKKERLIVQTEHKLARREKRWQRRIARPPAKADRHAARLQRRLDRRAARRYRKAMRHHDATVRRLDAAHEKRVERAHEQWRKAAQRAERRGQPAPAKPQAPRQEYPQEPVLGEVALTDHRWARREARYRRRMERKQARLEHRRERVMARALRRARRRAQRIARKLDDPEFLASHPLLAGSDAA